MNPASNPSRPAAGDGPAGSDGTALDALAARNFQHYQVLCREDGSVWELGRGTMGITYKALDTNLRSEVALKVVNSTLIDHPSARERFVREARAAAALRHRNVASVYHLGNDGEHFFYAMEFIDGETLDALVRREGPLPVETALRIALQVARALAAAARQKLVHRDIKPANLMVAHEDADDHLVVKVIDFGLARPAAGDEGEESGAGSLTLHGFVGTPQYASPEQLEELPLDARSDIYSLGVTLWFLLTGKPPFGGSLAVVCNQHLSKPPPWGALPATVPEPVRKLLAHLLEKDPAQRPQSALELRRGIDGCLAELLRARAPAPVAGEEDAPAANGPRHPMARLFGGRRIKRGGAVPAPVPVANESSVSFPATDTDRESGTVLDGRFALVRLVGEGSTGRVFEACDLADGRRTVAVKTLRPGSDGGSQAERDLLREDARQVGAAPHAHLVQLLAFEPAPPASSAPSFVAEEWLDGFTWRDLLAARHGALPVGECLHLLGQAASAIDHATSWRLERLELGLHQIHLHFPSSGVRSGSTDRRRLLASPTNEWPEWLVKVEPFGLGWESGETGTWAGEVTLLPGAALLPARASGGGSLARTYLHALARVACELLGGQPPATDGAGGHGVPVRQVSLPTLSEAGNAVLNRALADAPGFESAREFFGALAEASGFHADTLAPVASARSSSVVLPVPAPLPPEPERAPVVAEPATKDSSAQTHLFSPDGTPSRSPGTGDTATATTLYGIGVEEWEEEELSAAFYRGAPVEPAAVQEDPWQESRLARMLEEEEASKLVNPRSTGFVLTVGVILGLLLLMAGFATVVWRHENQPPATAKRGVRPPAAANDARRASSVAPVRSVPPGTPPPLPKARPSATPAIAAHKASTPVFAPAPAPAPVPAAVADGTPPLVADAPPAGPDDSPAGGQSSQPVISGEEARQRPDPTPRFNDKTVAVRVNTDPAGAEVFLQGASLGKTPLKLNLPPGDYQFIAHYRNWPEIRQDLHVADRQTEASSDIRLMSPAQVPLGPRFSPVLENRRRRRMRGGPYASDGISAAPAVPLERNVPVTRARPVVPRSDGQPRYREAAPADETPVHRALPALEPFVREGDPVPQNSPEREN